MELRHLRYFVTVAEELHFTRAAARLHVAQPALSHQIRELEQELGVALLSRTNRRVALTEAGRAFLERARVTLDDVTAARRSVQQVARGEGKRIDVGFVSLIGSALMSAAMRAHQRRFPDVEFAIQTLGAPAQLKALVSGALHVGVLERVIVHEGLHFDLISHEPLGVALPTNHRLASKRSIALRELASEPFIIGPSGERMSPYLNDLLAACAEAGFTPRIVQRAPVHPAFFLVAAGIGVYVTALTHATRFAEDVVVRPLRSPTLFVDFFAARRSDVDSPLVSAFVEELKRCGSRTTARSRAVN